MKNYKTAGVLVIVILVVMAGFDPVRSCYYRSQHQRYGRNFNEERHKLGVPEIPDTWRIERENNDVVWWVGNEKMKGHKRKTVIFSGKSIHSELDVYNLSDKNGQQRLLESEFVYKNDKLEDTTKYTYQVGSTLVKVTTQVADSIFIAENIKKD